MQWPEWFCDADRYWLVCALNEFAHNREPASIDALVSAVVGCLPSHLSAQTKRSKVIEIVACTAHLLFEQKATGGVRRKHQGRAAQQALRQDKETESAARKNA